MIAQKETTIIFLPFVKRRWVERGNEPKKSNKNLQITILSFHKKYKAFDLAQSNFK